MNFQIVKPKGILKNYIKQYCFMESDVNDVDIAERVIPTENVQLMFHYRNPFVVTHSDRSVTNQPRSIVSGLNGSYSDVTTRGVAGVVFVQFQPSGACNFFRFPLSHIENISIDLADIFNNDIRQIEEQLYLANGMLEKVACIEEFLLKKLIPISLHDERMLQKSIELIKQQRGQFSASMLSEKVSLTPKSLERKFSQFLGKSPKQFIKLVRFQETLKDFSQDKDRNITEYAYRNGYFDQSHFIKDFKTFSGFTPKAFFDRYPDFNYSNDW